MDFYQVFSKTRLYIFSLAIFSFVTLTACSGDLQSKNSPDTNAYEQVVSGIWRVDSTGETAVIDFLNNEKTISIETETLSVDVLGLDEEEALFKLSVEGMADVWLLQATQNEQGEVELYLYSNEEAHSTLTFMGELGSQISSVQETSYLNITLQDLRLDLNELVGEDVEVSAQGMYVSDMFMLKSKQMDANPLLIQVDNLSREERKNIMNKCSDLTKDCQITIFGRVELDIFEAPIFVATKAEF